MEKLINVAKFLRDVFYKAPDEDRSRNQVNYELTEKISFRCTKEEKELMMKYCELRNTELSEYLRVLNYNHITQFIIESDVEKEFYKAS